VTVPGPSDRHPGAGSADPADPADAADPTDAADPADPTDPASPRGRVPRDRGLDYGEDNRRRAQEFDARRGRPRGIAAPPPSKPIAAPGWYEPEAPTIEVPLVDDMFGLAAESPGVANQPPAPWMTGEHRRVEPGSPGPGRGTAVQPVPAPGPRPASAPPEAPEPPVRAPGEPAGAAGTD
jgi:hypothetical protein